MDPLALHDTHLIAAGRAPSPMPIDVQPIDPTGPFHGALWPRLPTPTGAST